MSTKEERALSEEELQELVAASDTGARKPHGTVGLMIAGIALVWSIFQVLLASPVAPYVLPGDLQLAPNPFGICSVSGRNGLSAVQVQPA